MNAKAKTGILIGVFALLLVVTIVAYRMLSAKVQPQTSAVSSSQGTSVSSEPSSSKPAAPDFTVQDAGGKDVSFSEFKGKPVVVNFWASWCPPCKAEMPDYEKMYREYSAKGVSFVMINMTDGSRETVAGAQKFLKENGYTFPAYFDEKQSAAGAYGISAIPDSVFIDKNGAIVSAFTGVIDANTMKNNLEAILK
jgi:thiol-disulfide isomerase/thioredoxin